MVALGAYFFPFFQPLLVAVPFATLLISMSLLIPDPWLAAYVGLIFFILLGVKDLIFIYRFHAYQLAVFLLYLLLTVRFLADAQNAMDEKSLAGAMFLAIAYFVLGKSLVEYQARAIGSEPSSHSRQIVVVAICSMVLWELFVVFLFLPIPFFLRAGYLFIVGVLLFDLALDYSTKDFKKDGFITKGMIFLFATLLVLGLNQWGL